MSITSAKQIYSETEERVNGCLMKFDLWALKKDLRLARISVCCGSMTFTQFAEFNLFKQLGLLILEKVLASLWAKSL